MLLSHITFDDGLDLSPPTNEEFRYEIGEEFVYHWILSPINPPVLFAAYNTRYIREMVFDQRILPNVSRDVSTRDTRDSDLSDVSIALDSRPIQHEICSQSLCTPSHEEDAFDINEFQESNDTDSSGIHPVSTSISEEEASSTTPQRLINLCTCDPVPDPNCPICNHEHIHAHKD